MNPQTSNRIVAFDIAKCLAIGLVIYGHTIQHYSTLNRLDNWAYTFVYSFHMPLFMIISGYFSVSSFRLGLWEFVKKKFKQLIVPVITFAFIMTFWFAFLEHRFLMSPFEYVVSFFTQCNTWLWFLRSLAICYLVSYLGEKIPNCKALYYAIIIGLIMFVDYCNLSIMLPCFLIGVGFRKKSFFSNYSTVKTLCVSTLLFALLFVVSNKLKWMPTLGTSVLELLQYLLLKCYKIIMGISGSIAIIVGLKIISEKFEECKLINTMTTVGQKTLALYVVQCLVVEIAGPIFIHPINQYENSQWLENLIIFPLIAIVFCGTCMGIVCVLERNKIVNKFLFGL